MSDILFNVNVFIAKGKKLSRIKSRTLVEEEFGRRE